MTITNNVASKLAVAFVAAAMLLTLAFAPSAKAATDAELQAQITALLAQIAALQTQAGGSTAQMSYTFTSNLTVGSMGADVMQLQKFLNNNGFSVAVSGAGSAGMETMYFGMLTRAAVAAYQSAKGIVPPVGYFGPLTRSSVNAHIASTVGNPPPPAPVPDDTVDTPSVDGDLSGGAGSIDSYDLASGYNNEEVGEDAEDVIVAGLEVENSDGSDIRVTALKLVFDEGTAASDFDNYASEVSIWLGSEEVARVDSDEFNDDNNWTKTLSLDSSAVIDSGDTDTLFVALSGVSNLDTADAGDTWTVDFTSMRFIDAQGSSISEDPTVGLTTFSFESFATANDTELKITEADEAVNDAHVIKVHATETTDNVNILSFNIEVEGDSDVNIDSLPVTLTSTETTGDDPDDLITTLYLYADGERIGSETLLTTDANTGTEVVVFDDLDYDISAGSDVDFTVKAKFVALSGVADAGDTVQATFGETETDLATFDAEDETGENLADADKTGSVIGETDTLYARSFNFTLGSAKGVAQTAGFSSDDNGVFTFKFSLTAFGGSVNIDQSCVEAQADAADQGIEFTVVNSAGTDGTPTCSFSSTAAVATGDTDAWTVQDGQTKDFTLTVATGDLSAGSHLYKVYLTSINWDDDTETPDVTPDLFYTAGLGVDKTSTDTVLINGV